MNGDTLTPGAVPVASELHPANQPAAPASSPGESQPAASDLTVTPVAAPAPTRQASPQANAAARTVLDGERNERSVQLEEENRHLRALLGNTEQRLKAREVEASHLQDENFRLKSVPAVPPPRKQRESCASSMFSFGRDEEESE